MPGIVPRGKDAKCAKCANAGGTGRLAHFRGRSAATLVNLVALGRVSDQSAKSRFRSIATPGSADS